MSQILGLITARGGSKSIPHKNTKLVAGKPLIAWTIEAALGAHGLSRVLVSTDDEDIAQVAKQWGAETPFLRPAELARDDSDHISVVEHALGWLAKHENDQPEYVMLLQPTSPLRTAEDIEAAIQIAVKRRAVAVVSICETKHHPYLSKRVLEDGTLAEFVSNDMAHLRRQELPAAHALNGAIFLNRRKSLLNDRTFVPLGTYAYIMPPDRSLDVDTTWDLYLAEMILRDRRER